jgi:hypothetical protein
LLCSVSKFNPNFKPVQVLPVIIVLALLACSPSRIQAQQVALEPDNPIVQFTLDSGVTLYKYFKAYDVAIDTLLKAIGENPLPEALGNEPKEDGWAFTWGEFEDSYVFIVKYEIVVDGNGNVTSFEAYEERHLNDTHHMLTARSYLAVKSHIEEYGKSYGLDGLQMRIAVLPFPEDGFTTYWGPAQTKAGMSRFGADFVSNVNRYTSQIIRTTRFHHKVMDIPLDVPEGGEAALMIPDAPLFSPMDVAIAMERGAIMITVTKSGNWRIYPDGKVDKFEW